MKKLVICLAAVAISVSASAQDFTWGVRAGLNIANIATKFDGTKDKDADSKVGFNVGVMADYGFSKSFSVESGLYYSLLGSKSDIDVEDACEKTTVNLSYIQLPLLATYKLAISNSATWSVQAGPYFAVGIGGKTKFEETYDGETEKYDMDSFGDGKDENKGFIQKFDMGLAFGTGVTFNKIYVGVKYELGLSNIACEVAQDAKIKMHNSNFSINVGYNF